MHLQSDNAQYVMHVTSANHYVSQVELPLQGQAANLHRVTVERYRKSRAASIQCVLTLWLLHRAAAIIWLA
jgi:hypothetical protein